MICWHDMQHSLLNAALLASAPASERKHAPVQLTYKLWASSKGSRDSTLIVQEERQPLLCVSWT